MLIFILLYAAVACSMGIGAIAKGEIVITKNKKLVGKGTKALGTLFLVSGVIAPLFLLVPSDTSLILAAANLAATAIISIVIAVSKGTPTVYATLADGQTARTKCPACRQEIDVTKKQIGGRSQCPLCGNRVFIGPF